MLLATKNKALMMLVGIVLIVAVLALAVYSSGAAASLANGSQQAKTAIKYGPPGR